MSTPKLGSMASAGLYFCGTAMLAAAILLIPFVYKPAAAPCECPPVVAPLPMSAPAPVAVPVAPPPAPPVTPPAQVTPASSGEARDSASTDKPEAPPANAPSSEQTSWRFEFAGELKLDEAQTGLALQIGESLRTQPKARALVVGHGGNGAASRAKNAARLVRDEVAKAGISSKRMTTEVVEEPGNRGLNVTVELKLAD